MSEQQPQERQQKQERHETHQTTAREQFEQKYPGLIDELRDEFFGIWEEQQQ